MRLFRQSRVFAAMLALVSVLFTQLAVAGYLCPSMQIRQAMESVAAAATAVEHHDIAACAGVDGAEMVIACHDYGQSRNQSLDKPELPNVPPFTATMLMQTVRPVDHPTQSVVPRVGDQLNRTAAPPLAIRNCCFRI